jgi:hypothetical protein
MVVPSAFWYFMRLVPMYWCIRLQEIRHPFCHALSLSFNRWHYKHDIVVVRDLH